MIWTARPERPGMTRRTLGFLTMPLNEVVGWTMLIAGASYWGGVIRTYQYDGPVTVGSILQSILGDGAFNIAGWLMIAFWTRSIAPRAVASRWQIAGALALGLVFAVPTRQATIVGLFALGLTLVVRPGTRHARLVAALIIGLAVEMVWSSTYLLPLHSTVALFDAKLCSTILHLVGESVQAKGNLLINAQAANNVEILAPCASSFPLGGVTMAFIVVMLYLGRLPRRADLRWFAMAILASIGLTEFRLSFMALGEPNYFWMHDGDGGVLYSLGATSLAVLFPIMAMWRSHSDHEPSA